MKILILSDDPSITTGYGNTTTFLCKGFLRNGWDVYAFSFNTFGITEEYEYQGIKVLPNPYANIDNQIYGNRDLFEKYYKKYKPDAILLHNDFYRFSYLAECSEEIRNKCFFWIPEDQPNVDDWVFEHRKFKHIVYLTKYAYDMHKRFFDKDQVHFLYQGIDFHNFKEYDKSLLKAEYGLQDKFVISTVSKNQPRKMYPQMVKAIGEFFKDKEDVFWLVKAIPDDPLGYNIKPLIEEFNLQSKVKFDTNNYEDRGILYRQIYQTSDVFMLLSGGEGFGMPFVEALYCQIPVVATDAVSNKEIIGPGGLAIDVDQWTSPSGRTDGVVYAEASIEDFCKKMNILYEDWKADSKLINEIGKRGREHALKYFYSEDINDQWDLFIKSKIGYYQRKTDSLGYKAKAFSIIIVTQNNFNNLLRLIKSIRDNTNKVKYEIIIVNNGSTDETASLLDNLKDDTIKVIDFLYEKSTTASINKALHYTKYKHVLIINDKAIVKSDYEVKSPLEFICGDIDNPGEEWCLDLFDYCEEVKIVTDGIRRYKVREKTIETQVSDGFVFFHKDILKDIGYFDEQYTYSVALLDFIMRGKTYGHDQEGYDPSKRIELEDADPLRIDSDTIEKLYDKQIKAIAQENKKDPMINIVFHSLYDQGYASDSALYPIIDEIRKMPNVNAYIEDIREPYKNSIIPDDVIKNEIINIYFWLMWELQKFDAPNKVAMTYMENTKLAPHFKAGIDTCDAIFTYDHFNQIMFQNSNVNIPIHLIPLLPDLQYKYHERNADFPFYFLCVGSYDQRKNLIYAVDNFWKIFGGNENIHLIMKTSDERVAEYCGQDHFKSQIECIHEMINERDLLELFHRSHCLISPTSGEGCGMPILEAMATGMPVIATKWSGILSFCNDLNSYLINVKKMVTAYGDPVYGVWAWPDASHFRELMYQVVNNYDEALIKGKKASEDVRASTHKDSAEKMVSIIKNTDWRK